MDPGWTRGEPGCPYGPEAFAKTPAPSTGKVPTNVEMLPETTRKMLDDLLTQLPTHIEFQHSRFASTNDGGLMCAARTEATSRTSAEVNVVRSMACGQDYGEDWGWVRTED